MEIVRRFTEGKNDDPPVEVITNPLVLERNDKVPEEVFAMLEALPTYVVPGRIYRTQSSRLHSLAVLLSADHIVEDAVAQARITPNGTLKAERSRLDNDGFFQKELLRVRSLKIERSYVWLSAETLTIP